MDVCTYLIKGVDQSYSVKNMLENRCGKVALLKVLLEWVNVVDMMSKVCYVYIIACEYV